MERLKVKISSKIIDHCKKQVEKHNFAKRQKNNGNTNQQYI